MADPEAVQRSIWFSSATAALAAALEAMDAKGKLIAVPPNVCPNVAGAIYGAGAEPYFVDIEADSQGIDPERLAEVVEQVGAVIAVHAYGVPCRIEEIARIATAAGVPLIEDCAQADGATVAGREVGSFGDIAVFSFGKGKIVEAGGGGLALVGNQRWLAPVEAAAARWPASSDANAGVELNNTYRSLYNKFYPGRTALAREDFYSAIGNTAPGFRARCNPGRIDALIAARKRRDSLISARRRKYRLYAEQLEGAACVTPVPLHEGAAPWRFNALVEPGLRDEVFRKLRGSGINASTWYPRLTEFLPERSFRATGLPVARQFEQTLLNLWLDEATPAQEIVQTCATLRQHVRKSDT